MSRRGKTGSVQWESSENMKKKTLEALEKALKAEAGGPPEDGEFTVIDYMNYFQSKGIDIKRRAAHDRLDTKVRNGEYSMRKGLVGGRIQNIFKPNK